MTQTHLRLQAPEFIRHTGLDLATHPLPSPLLEAIELFIDIHRDRVKIYLYV